MSSRIDSGRPTGAPAPLPPDPAAAPATAPAQLAPAPAGARGENHPSAFDATSRGAPLPVPERPLPARDLGFEAVQPANGPVVQPDKDGPVDPKLPNRPNGPSRHLLNFEWWCNGGLARGNQPTTKRIDDLAHKFGFKSVINLRAESNSDQATCQKDGLSYLHVNWVDKTAPTEDQIKQILDFATQGQNQPAYIHCMAGENRTSLAVACYRMACEGWPLDKARTEADSFGMHEPVQEQFLTQFASDLAAGKIAGYPLGTTPAGSEQLFEEGQAGAKPILDAIDGAKSSVDLSIYLMTDPAVISALESAAKRGVNVRVMIEPNPVGSGTSPFPALQQQLEAAGCKVETTPPQFDSSNNVDHAKFMTVDGATTLIGTGNLVRSSLEGGSTGNRDFWLQDTRPETAKEAEQLFNADWNRTTTDPSSFQNLVVTPDNASQKMLGFIDGAQKTLLVYNQELVDPEVINHLIAAKQRGVDVQVLTAAPKNGGTDNNAPIVKQLQDAGIPAKEMTKNYLHAKAMVADGQAFIGSQNFSVDGLTKNRELGEIVGDAGVVTQLAQDFQADWAAN